MAKQLSSKVEHCPRCRKLKAKGSACKSCGYSAVTVAKTPSYTIKGLDVTAISSININGVIFKK